MAEATPAIERPVIAYVDEDEDALEDFLIDADNSNLFREVIILKPEAHLADMVEALLALPIDALVSDFRLSDASPVEYDGGKLVSAYLATRADFPCFIRTSWDNDALHGTDDVNRVYSKEGGSQDLNRPLFERISLQIAHYKQQLQIWSDELETLLAIDRSTLSAAQIERIVELDTRIEAQFGADHAVSQAARRAIFDGGLYSRRQELLADTEKLIADIKRSLGEEDAADD
ncbi:MULTISPECIES: hypothetical protein [unclassified Sphingomonas]|uniref:hypothetical protein n=1 Tax=unclassified Sphingomonas TaxID=196159 RepID=UPI0008325204|nr:MULTISPECIES: hypothetical protein [unclassified Sphingomonas]